MFKDMTDDAHLSGGQSSSSPAGHGVTSAGLVSQESSWIGLLSVVSRPALSFVQRYLPGRAPAHADWGPRWTGAGLQSNFTHEERDFLKQLEHAIPFTRHAAAHLTDMQSQQVGAPGPLEPGQGAAPPWLTAASLRDLGIEDTEELNLCPHSEVGYLSSFRTFVSHVLLNPVSAQEVNPRRGTVWQLGSKGGTWWGSLWGGEDSSQRALSCTEDQTETNRLCPHQPGTYPPTAETTIAFVQSGSEESTLGENTGASEHKEEQTDNGGPHAVQNREGSPPDLSISNTLSSPGGGACSKSPLLTPDQDNGYSSLEEEHFLVKTLSEETQLMENCVTTMQDELSEETSENTDEDKQQQQQPSVDEAQSADNVALSAPECQNKAIAFIMGCPCSDDDDDSSSLSESSDDDDDDGFDSERSSDSSDEDEASDSDSEVDSESERLWNSLCQSVDPYNPQSFSAQQHSKQPRTIPPDTPPSPPTASPPESSSPLSSLDVWDDSTSASEADEVESIRLLSSFSCSSDPYSPFNFQAPIRTKGPEKVVPKARAKRAPQTPPQSPHHKTASPEYRKDGAEERLDSGFSEPAAPVPTTVSSSSTPQSAASTKRVRFCDQVEEFFLSCEEDRRSPWEQLARDRCRFLRRCQEVEQSISFCLQPQHRRLVYRRIVVLHSQDTLSLHMQNEDILEHFLN